MDGSILRTRGQRRDGNEIDRRSNLLDGFYAGQTLVPIGSLVGTGAAVGAVPDQINRRIA